MIQITYIQMGIPHLNRFLMNNCSNQSIGKKHLSSFAGKVVVVDASIYMYKFSANNMLIENMYHLLSVFKYHRIVLIFVFDGKPPDEKRDVLEQRFVDKQIAEKKYNELKQSLSNSEADAEILSEMERLKKQFIRIRKEDIFAVKNLLSTCGVSYYDAPGEADQLCAKMVLNRDAWACLSDDMDMFVYGCTRVMRYVSLMNHTVVFYNVIGILRELEMSMSHFREILVLSGTDYNHDLSESSKLVDLMKQYQIFLHHNPNPNGSFYTWMCNRAYNTSLIESERFHHIYDMFHITDLKNNIKPVQSKGSVDDMKCILKRHGFIFV